MKVKLSHVHKISHHLVNVLLLQAACLILSAIVIFIIPIDSFAVSAFDPFGAKIVSIVNCTCPNNLGIIINAKSDTGTKAYFWAIDQEPFKQDTPIPGGVIVGKFNPDSRASCYVFTAETACQFSGLTGYVIDKAHTNMRDQ